MNREFPYNQVILSGEYSENILKLVFKKNGKLEKRVYENVPAKVACPLFYKESAKELLSYFAKHIKKKFKIKQITSITNQ